MSREGKLVKNTMILGLGSFFPRLTAFITLPILTGYLTKAEYGTYDLITVLVSLILPAATLQIQSAAFRFLIDERGNEERKKSIISNIFAFIVPTSLLVLCVLYLFLPGDMMIRILICAYFFADILVNASRQVARGLHMNLRYSISAIISATGKMVFAVIFVLYMKMGLMGAVLALMLSDLLSFIYMAAALNLPHYIDLRLVNKKDLKALLDEKSGGVEQLLLHRCLYEYIPKLFDAWQLHKNASKIQSFNDMIRNVYKAIVVDNSQLVQALRQKYLFAIIDEFQDTNLLQWEIFKRVFFDANDGKHHILVVGDPKQSIYSFQ